jgi:hypothetical protein
MPKKAFHSLNDSPGQKARYFLLVAKAWKKHGSTGDIFVALNNRAAETQFRREINLAATGCYSIKEMNQTTDFDAVMLELAIIAEDLYWINRLSSAAERRIKWVIEKQFIPDLEFLLKEPVPLSYIKGIAKQAGLPTEFMDCPARDMLKILQMTDTHIRRLAKRNGVEVIDLPSGYFRRGVRPVETARAKFRHDHHHHITQSKEGVTA